MPTRQLPKIEAVQSKVVFYDQNDDEILDETNFTHSGELFYYQTSSSSASPSLYGQSDQENNEEQCQTDQQDDEDVDDEDAQTSLYEYDPWISL